MENLFLSPTLSFNANCHLAKSPFLIPVPFSSAKWPSRQFKSIVPNSINSRDKDDVSIPPLLSRPESKFSITKQEEVQGKGKDEGDEGQLKEKVLYLESIGVDSYRLVGENKQISTTSLQSIMSVVKLLQSMGIDMSDIGRLVGMCPEALTLAPRQIRAVFTFLLREAKVQLRDIKRPSISFLGSLACAFHIKYWLFDPFPFVLIQTYLLGHFWQSILRWLDISPWHNTGGTHMGSQWHNSGALL